MKMDQGTIFQSGRLAANMRKRWVTVIAIVIPMLTGISRYVIGLSRL